jgi:hypothetical protein
MIASIQTFGSLANWHPHLHCLVTDGAFLKSGTFLHLGFHQIEILTEAFRRALLGAFVRRELLTRDISDKADGPTAGTHEFGALEFLARLLTHVPDKSSIYVWYPCDLQVLFVTYDSTTC